MRAPAKSRRVAKQDADGRLAVRKMYKLYVGGQFTRSESGRSDTFGDANVARASRKDLRDAIVAARTGYGSWYGTTPALRGQVLYRLTEMMEGRRAELTDRLSDEGLGRGDARKEVDLAIDRVLWYAGWCDKYAAVLSSRNPVAGPHFNFSTPEPMGIVGVVAPDRPSLLGLVTAAIPPLVSGNSVVAIASETDPRTPILFAECVATSDMPAGALNILTGKRADLIPHLARHMDVNAVAVYCADPETNADVTRMASENLKRVHLENAVEDAWTDARFEDLDRVAAFTEIKTIWHPAAI
jgi:acyl-CoA reductase-like NAD-dependent aldehyde dehydrogenase